MSWNRLPNGGKLSAYRILLPLVLVLGFAPFLPQPHLIEKIGMLRAGTLNRPRDVFDLFWHGWPFLLLAWRLWGDLHRLAARVEGQR